MPRRVAYSPRSTPMRHQVLAVKASEKKPQKPSPDDVFAFLCDMGTGKTKIILDEWGEMAMSGGPQDLLVCAPAGSYRNWYNDDPTRGIESEITKHLDPRLRQDLVVQHWQSGPNKAKMESLREFMRVQDRPRALVVNVEAISTVDKARELVEEFLAQRLAYFAVDESTTIKSPKAIRSKNIIRMGEEAAVRRIATGLLTPNGPLDAFSQFNFLDWRILGHRSFYSFRAKYAVLRRMDVGGRKFDVVVGYRNLEELSERIAPYSYRILKSQCLDLEPKIYTRRDVEMTKEQRRIDTELRATGMTMIGDAHVSIESMLQLVMRRHQIELGYVVDEDGNEHLIEENRTDELVQVLSEHRGKAIIWCPWVLPLMRVVDRLKKEFGEKSVALFYGGNRGTRHEDEARFKSDPDCRFMCATQGAGMRGNNWVEADLVVYYANDHDLEKRDQSEDRAYRKGQQKRVTYVDMMVPRGVGEKIVHALRKKLNIATEITREGYRAWLV